MEHWDTKDVAEICCLCCMSVTCDVVKSYMIIQSDEHM